MSFFKDLIARKSLGFYLGLASAIICICCAVAYAIGFGTSPYMSWAVFALLLVCGAAYVALALVKVTEDFAAWVSAAMNLVCLCLWINTVYMYLTEVFYGGVNAQSIKTLNPAFLICLIGLWVSLGLSVASIFLKQSKKELKEKTA